MSVEVQLASGSAGLPAPAELVRWASAALKPEAQSLDLTIRIVDQDEGIALNRDYRGGDDATNVLSFAFDSPPGVEVPLLGDVVICAPVITREANEQGKSSNAHFAHMVVHGVLHLQGYDHQCDADAQRMESREAQVLGGLGFADPYFGEER
jgi:probable rRNA maturation factor